MKLPVDIPAVITAAIDIERASGIPVSVNILIDESVSPDFQAFVRAGFNSTSPNSRVWVSYFPTQTPDPTLACDVTIIAAGSSESVGSIAASYRDNGTPVLVVAEKGEEVLDVAQAQGHPLPEQDVVFPHAKHASDAAKEALGAEIGSWLVSAVGADKKLAFSIAYPFVRRPLAHDAVRSTALQNAGIGVVVFVPGADMPLMTANQIKMILQIAAAYGQPLGPERVKEMVGVLINAFIFRSVSRQVAGLVPALGWAVKGAFGYLGTQAIGRAAIEYFEGGGSMAGLAALAGKATQETVEVVSFVRSEPTVRAAAQTVAPYAKRAVTSALDGIVPVAKSAGKTALSSLRGRKKRQ